MSQDNDRAQLESVAEELENLDIEDEEDVPEPDPKLLKSQFRLFAKFGDTSADGKTIKVMNLPLQTFNMSCAASLMLMGHEKLENEGVKDFNECFKSSQCLKFYFIDPLMSKYIRLC